MKLIQLSKQDIIERYLNKPILIDDNNKKEWYLVCDVDSFMPLHMLTDEESDLYDQDTSNIDGIRLIGVDGEGYTMWIYFNQDNGWKAYGYE